MGFTLMALPYDKKALEPHISAVRVRNAVVDQCFYLLLAFLGNCFEIGTGVMTQYLSAVEDENCVCVRERERARESGCG